MKISHQCVLLGLLVLGSYALQGQGREWTFSSGLLLQDPITGELIRSPYLSFALDGQTHWTIYDPNAIDGRFVANASTYTGAVGVGFVRGSLHIGSVAIELPTDRVTAVALHADPRGNMTWLHAHDTELHSSQFHSVLKLKDGGSIISGFEYHDKVRPSDVNEYAILKRVDRHGEVRWENRLPGSMGYTLQQANDGAIFWMTAKRTGIGFQSVFLMVKPSSGQIVQELPESGLLADHRLPDPMSFIISSDNHLISARVVDGEMQRLTISKYDMGGGTLWSKALLHFIPSKGMALPQGLVERPDGHLQIATNLTGEVILEKPAYQVGAEAESDVLMLGTNGEGQFLGHAQYHGERMDATGLYPIRNQFFLAGSHIGDVNIPDENLKYLTEGGQQQAYAVPLLEHFDPIVAQENLPVKDLTSLDELKVYPNPVKGGQVHLSFGDLLTKDHAFFEVYDGRGVLLMTEGYLVAEGTQEHSLNVSNLSVGLYHVLISQDRAYRAFGKFIISQ